MIRFQYIRQVVPALVCLLLLSNPLLADELPLTGGQEENPLMFMDDFTNSLLSDDQTSTESDDPPPLNNDPSAPVDGGLSLLLAAGAAYGARRLRKSTKENMKPKGDT